MFQYIWLVLVAIVCSFECNAQWGFGHMDIVPNINGHIGSGPYSSYGYHNGFIGKFRHGGFGHGGFGPGGFQTGHGHRHGHEHRHGRIHGVGRRY